MDENKVTKINKNVNIINLCLTAVEMVFLILAAMAFGNILSDDNYGDIEIGVNGTADDMSDSQDAILYNVGTVLYRMVAYNSGDNVIFEMDGAEIREGSRRSMRFSDQEFVSFIVDIPEIRQSYYVYYIEYDESEMYSDTPEVSAACLTRGEDIVYEDFACKNMEDDSFVYAFIVGHLLQYADFDGFIAYIDPGEESMSHIRIVSGGYEYTEEQSERYIRETKEFIESLGISPELFSYSVESAPLGESDEPIYVY